MSTVTYLKRPADGRIALPATDGMPAAVHILDEDSVLAVNAALTTQRPLLVRGEPGTGKSQLARAAAVALGRAFIPHAVDGRTETRDLLYTVNAVARLAMAQVVGALQVSTLEEAMRRVDIAHFIEPGPLWWAFAWGSAAARARRKIAPPPGWTAAAGVVVLIDEIDKADAAVPNGLLDALGHGRFDVEGVETVEMDRAHAPLVIITTNEERALPDAFLRRCLVLHLALPEKKDELLAVLMTRGQAHFPQCNRQVLAQAAELLAQDREAVRRQDLIPPGLAEYIDLVRAVTGQTAVVKEQVALLERIAKFALRKHPPELGR